MPTPTQVRYHYKKVKNLFTRLEQALFQAHKFKVLNYVELQYQTDSPCPLVYDADHRFEECCKVSLAAAMKYLIMCPPKPRKKKKKPLATVHSIG